LSLEVSITEGSRILIVGASGGIGSALLQILSERDDLIIGAHGASRLPPSSANVHGIQKVLRDANDCFDLVDRFVELAGGIDHLVVALGGISKYCDVLDVQQTDWDHDIFVNLSAPFFLAQRAVKSMINCESESSIVLFGTQSASHGGGANSLGYGVAKRGIDCLVKGLGRRLAPDHVRVNAVVPGFINSGFHERWQAMSEESRAARVSKIPLGRAGTVSEVSFLVSYLLSEQSSFITGETFAIAGGDWL